VGGVRHHAGARVHLTGLTVLVAQRGHARHVPQTLRLSIEVRRTVQVPQVFLDGRCRRRTARGGLQVEVHQRGAAALVVFLFHVGDGQQLAPQQHRFGAFSRRARARHPFIEVTRHGARTLARCAPLRQRCGGGT